MTGARVRRGATARIRALGGPALALWLLSAGCGEPEPLSIADQPRAAATAPRAEALAGWPPRLGQTYPDFEFRDLSGRAVRLSSFEGKVLLIEPIGMNCPACNAFSGANRPGMRGFRGLRPQAGLDAIESYLPTYAGITIDHRDLVFVQLLLYDFELGAPTPTDLRAWVDHFGLDRLPNYVALVADDRFQNAASYRMIPGFQLVDRNLVLRADATGHRPRHDLYRELLPLLGDLLEAG